MLTRSLSSGLTDEQPTVVYVSEIAPINTAASSVVIFRHLLSLERLGYRICVITPEQPGLNDQLPLSWLKLLLPARRAFYPPYRPKRPLMAIRWRLLDRIVRPVLADLNVHCLIGLLASEYLVNYADWLSRKLPCPLFYFYHDRGERLHFWNRPNQAKRLRLQNLRLLENPNLRRVWTVSKELIYPTDRNKSLFSIVYPLPERFVAKAPARQHRGSHAPTLAHIGTVYIENLPSMRQMLNCLGERGGRMLLYSQFAESAKILANDYPEVVRFVGFEPNSEALLTQVVQEADAFFLSYPNLIETMPWSLNSFPSKFVQLVQTGLPGLIFAPAETAVGRWCVANDWTFYQNHISPKTICSALDLLGTEEGWLQGISKSRAAALGPFDPAMIENLVNTDVLSARPDGEGASTRS